MLQFLKWVKVSFWIAIFLLLVSPLALLSIHTNSTIPPSHEIIGTESISPSLGPFTTSAIFKSRASAVMVQSASLRFWSGRATMTGTYFVAQGKHYVITVHHGIHGPCWLTTIVYKEERYACKRYVTLNEEKDYVIIELDGALPERTPIRIPLDLPQGKQWNKSYSILNTIVYTGYPNAIGPLTLRGDVVGYNHYEYVYVFSHAYGGASGSGVFTANGKYIGHIVAIDVGSTELGVDILENIVIVVPAFNVDWSVVLN
ncbi:MAG TPA: hypothetical protein DGZ24_00700 [Rhodospirillaceae bacterium]|nr:hypothetical protein [Rhodospirillaceae bacterium]